MSERSIRRGEMPKATVLPAEAPVAKPRKRRFGLSLRVLLMATGVGALAALLIYVPSLSSHRMSWLSDRIAAANVAGLVLDASPTHAVSEELATRLLQGVGARAIVIRDGEASRLLSMETMPETVAYTVDLRTDTQLHEIYGAFRTMVIPTSDPIRIVDHGSDGFDVVEVLVSEKPLRDSMVAFSMTLLLWSLLVAAAATAVVFALLQQTIVRPVGRLAGNLIAYAAQPDDVSRIIVPTRRTDEIGDAEVALARTERALADELREKRRLAELGLSVSKINHELRNLLATAQLLGDRLGDGGDPNTRRLAPRLVATLDRAVRFCEATLAYGRATERHPQRRLTLIAPILAELPDIGALAVGNTVLVTTEAPSGMQVCADPEQLSRALHNLVRNAVQACDREAAPSVPGVVRIVAEREGGVGSGRVVIRVSDNGPGLPYRVRQNLFTPFKGSASGGAGLGLAIAYELIELNGGSLSLERSEQGTTFRIDLPDVAPNRPRAA